MPIKLSVSIVAVMCKTCGTPLVWYVYYYFNIFVVWQWFTEFVPIVIMRVIPRNKSINISLVSYIDYIMVNRAFRPRWKQKFLAEI